MRYVWFAVFSLALARSVAAQSQSDIAAAVKERLASVPPQEASTCVQQSITCGQTIQGSLDTGDCTLPSSGNFVDYFQFAGTKEEQIKATLTTTTFNPFLELLDPSQNLIDSAMGNAPGTVQVSLALPQAGTWSLGVTNSGAPTTGSYTLALTCGNTAAGCLPNDTTLCAGNGRFAVQATFNAGGGNSGNAHAVALTR